MRLLRLLPALVVACTLAAGCAEDGQAGPLQDDQGRYVVRLLPTAFDVRELRVPVGATVLFVNDAAVPHNVEGFDERTGSTFSSEWPEPHGMGRPFTAEGDAWERTFTEPGTWRLHCHYHHAERMAMSLHVAPA